MTRSPFVVVGATGADLLKALWLGVALTSPLFAVGYVRLDLDSLGIHIAVPMAGLMGVVAVGTVMLLMRDGSLRRPLLAEPDRSLLIVLYVFLLWHVFSLLFSSSPSAGRKEVVKLMMATVCFWGTLAFFPRERRFLARFLELSLWAAVPLLGYLVYVYAFVFRAPYLGTDLGEEARFGRAQLAWYLSVLFPYAFFYFWKSRHKLARVLPAMVLLVSLLYVQTRGAWISVAGGLAYAAMATWRADRAEALKMTAAIAIGGTLMIGTGLVLIAAYVDITELVTRFVSIYRPQDVPELHSYEIRWAAISDAFAGFRSSPIIGVGVGSTLVFVERLTHNDVATILLELGLIGLMVFVVLLLLLARASGALETTSGAAADWLTLGSRAGFVNWVLSMMFINVYTSVQFWLFPALFVLAEQVGASRAAARAPAGADGRMAPALADSGGAGGG